ncbi:MAG: hypothetical protein WD058_03260 [Dehalococcoidia bacterium]
MLDRDLYLVGGGVRDLALRRPLHDLDLASSGEIRPLVDAIVQRLPAHTAVEVADRFGTASIRLPGRDGAEAARLDLARLRTERYVAPGALPDVRATDSIEADLARRDFSVNAVALGLAGSRAGEVVDPCGGLDDLAARRLRVLHDRSFEDDATRLWRGARTAALFRLAPDAATARLIEGGTRWLETVSGDRLWAEFDFTARRGRAGATFALLDRWGVLRGIEPHWTLPEASAAALRRRTRPLDAARLAAVVLAPLPRRAAVMERLNAPREARLTVEDAARLLDAGRQGARSDTSMLATLEGARDEARVAARWLDPDGQRTLQAALRRWERTRPHLDAAALLDLGVPRGPELGRTQGGLRRARYLGTLGGAVAARREVRRRLDSGEGWA